MLSPVAVVVELVVGAECEEGADADAVRVEDLVVNSIEFQQAVQRDFQQSV